MKKLSKTTIAERDAIAARLRAAYDELQEATQAFDDAIEGLFAKVQEAQDAYNEVIDDANSWKAQIVQDIDDYVADRSEKWQESDKASEYESWKSEYEDDYAHAELSQPEPLDIGDVEDYEPLMEQLPEEVS